jgi:putative ATP-dependent endonuclease of the OLD family
MKLSKIKIENFRCFEDETVLFNAYTCLVGANGSGKSTVLSALKVFFGDTPGATGDFLRLQKDDFHNRDSSRDIAITLTFADLEPEAEEEFKHYVRNGELIVSAVASWNELVNFAEVKRFGERLVMKSFAEFFRAEGDGKRVPELQTIYAKIRESYPTLPAPGTKPAMKSALNDFEANHPELCELARSDDLFYGFTGGSDRLKKFIEWVPVPAVKDASTEQLEAKKNALGVLLERTVRSKISFADKIKTLRTEVEKKYEQIISDNQGALKSLSDSLTAKLQEWAHPDALLALLWRNDPTKNISIQEPQAEVRAGERLFQGASLAHFGHGLQRSFLLALLQELASCDDTRNPRLLLACEEPELYQHPPQARHLSSVLQKLSDANSQVIVSTHSPHFIPGRGFEDVRILRQQAIDSQPCVRQASIGDVSDILAEARGEKTALPSGVELKIEQALQPVLNEMFFANVLILVEGPEDLGYIASYLTLTNRYDEFRRLGCHMVPTTGKGNMQYPLAIAKALEIPTFVIFDADGDKIERPDMKAKHQKDNIALLRLCGVTSPNPFPDAVFTTSSLVMWPKNIGFEVRNDFGTPAWEELKNRVRENRQLIGAPDLEKNALFIGHILAAAHEKGVRSKVLDQLSNQIIAFALSVRAAPAKARSAPATAAGV